MKKIIAIVAVLILAVCSMSLVACGGGVEGKYSFDSFVINETTYKVGDTLPAELGGMVLTQDDADEYGALELTSDGKVIMTSEDYSAEGTYTVSDGVVTATIEGSTQELKVENGMLIFEQPGPSNMTIKVCFKKA